ncbi:hypothetical protein Tco_0968245 [Tanacetum coccineum]
MFGNNQNRIELGSDSEDESENEIVERVEEQTDGLDLQKKAGTIARNASYAPLTYSSWSKVPDKEMMWKYVLEKYIVPEKAKSWVLMTIGACPGEIVKSPTVSLEVEKGQSIDMQRDLEANFERRISELKEDQERKLEAMQKK